jgi:DNA-binding transcriptional ArsR family regulator
MEIAGVDQELIDWSSTRRQQIEQALEGITDQYVAKHKRLPGERARHGLAWQAAQDTRPEKKKVLPLQQLLAWWRTFAILRFGVRMVDGLLERCRAAGKVIRARVDPLVDTALAAVDVAAVVFTVRGTFARRHVLAEARRHFGETLHGRAFEPGLDDDIADQALDRHGRQLTYTADFARPARWWIAGADGKPPRLPADLADALGISRTRLSNHLACLRDCGLVVTVPDGRRTRYELADERLGHALDDLRTAVVAVETDRTCTDAATKGCC